MTEPETRSVGQTIFGSICIAVGLGVFVIRLGHEGPYAMPHGGALYGGIALFVLGGLSFWKDKPPLLKWAVLLVSPVALFPAIYSMVGESEEVISLYATDSAGRDAFQPAAGS